VEGFRLNGSGLVRDRCVFRDGGKDTDQGSHQDGDHTAAARATVAFCQGPDRYTWKGHPDEADSESGSSASTSHPPAVVNTSNFTTTDEFQTTAEELYNTFLDPQRVAAFTRAPPVLEPKVGGAFSLFGGNISGKFTLLTPGKEIVQDWRLKTWVDDHHCRLTLVFDQSLDGVTMRATWQGVPVGQEDVVKHNFESYYVRPIKQTFGFGAVL